MYRSIGYFNLLVAELKALGLNMELIDDTEADESLYESEWANREFPEVGNEAQTGG